VDREDEEEVKKMIRLWKKQGKAREGEGVILTRCGTVIAGTCHSIAHQVPFLAQNHASPFNYIGRKRGRGNDVGPTRQWQ
jgi:hypothetical protein